MNILKKRTRATRRTLLLFLLCLLSWVFSVSLFACKPKNDLSDLVSEYRNNLFLYEDETLSVKAHNLQREYPYVADGYKGEMTFELTTASKPNRHENDAYSRMTYEEYITNVYMRACRVAALRVRG